MCELSSVTPLWLFGKPINVRCVLRYYYFVLSLCCSFVLPRSHLKHCGTMNKRESNNIETIETDLNKCARFIYVFISFIFIELNFVFVCFCAPQLWMNNNGIERVQYGLQSYKNSNSHANTHTHTFTLSQASITRYLRSRELKCSCAAVKVVLP